MCVCVRRRPPMCRVSGNLRINIYRKPGSTAGNKISSDTRTAAALIAVESRQMAPGFPTGRYDKPRLDVNDAVQHKPLPYVTMPRDHIATLDHDNITHV